MHKIFLPAVLLTISSLPLSAADRGRRPSSVERQQIAAAIETSKIDANEKAAQDRQYADQYHAAIRASLADQGRRAPAPAKVVNTTQEESDAALAARLDAEERAQAFAPLPAGAARGRAVEPTAPPAPRTGDYRERRSSSIEREAAVGQSWLGILTPGDRRRI